MKLACVQAPVEFNAPERNADYATRQIATLSRQSVDLAVFPEAFLTGYCVESVSDAREIAIPYDHPSLVRLAGVVNDSGVAVIVGFAGREGDTLRNAVALFEPGREPRYYAKTHLPHLGFDRFVTPGDSLSVFDTRMGAVAPLICYDMRPPEATRVLALDGADLIVLPTNWPRGAESSAEHICIARAAENRVFFASCNRVGHENGFDFIGRSKIIDPNGGVIAAAGSAEETIIAELDLSESRLKRRVMIPGKYEIDVFACRNPELYASLAPTTQNAP